MSDKKTRKLTRKQQKLLEGIIEGKTGHQAALDAGYSPKNPDHSAYQAMKQLDVRMREVMDRLELTDMHLIQKHLVPKLDARETKFFPWRKTTKRGTKQVIDVREVAALSIQILERQIVADPLDLRPSSEIQSESLRFL